MRRTSPLTQFASLLLVFGATAAVAGEIVVTADTTFTAAGSPYTVDGFLTIDVGARLTIEPGVECLMGPEAAIVIKGGLTCQGTVDSMVVFRPHSTRWSGILLEPGSENSVIHCAEFHDTQSTVYGTTTINAAVTARNTSSVNVTDCLFDDQLGEALRFAGGAGSITRNTFLNQHQQAIIGFSSTAFVIDNYFGFSGDDPVDWDDPDVPSVLAGNVFEGTFGDCIDLDYFEGRVVANIIQNCTDKGISVSQDSNALVQNNLIKDCGTGLGVTASSVVAAWNNSIVSSFLGMHAEKKHEGYDGAHIDGANNIIWDVTIPVYADTVSSVTLVYSDVAGDTVLAGAGNINADPLFVDLANFDLHLQSGSPCIDAGDSDGAPAVDFESEGRVDDPNTPNTGVGPETFYDMGADEFQPPAGAIVVQPAAPSTAELTLAPNPLPAAGSFHVHTPTPGQGTLRLYDVNGRLQRQWNDVFLPGRVAFDQAAGEGPLGRGIYYLAWNQAGGKVFTSRVAILR